MIKKIIWLMAGSLMVLLLSSGCAKPAQFEVSALNISPTEVISGESVTITAQIINIGASQGTYTATLTMNSEFVGNKDVTLAAGARETVTFRITQDVPGTYQISVNQLTGTLKVLRPAAYMATSLTVTPVEVTIGESVTVTADITNTGEIEGIYAATLLVDGSVAETRSVTISARETETISFTYHTDTTGTHSLQIGQAKGTLKVLQAATFVATQLSITPAEILAGRTMTVRATVENIGEAGDTYKVALKIDDVIVDTKEVTLAAGATKTVEFTLELSRPGTCTVEVDGLRETITVLSRGHVPSYVILTNIDSADPYYAGVEALKKYREAQVVHFEGEVASAKGTLQQLKPAFVAIVVKPDVIDEGFAFAVFTLAKNLDQEYDTDFAYGFISGANPRDIVEYVNNLISYETGERRLEQVFRGLWSTIEDAFGGGIGGWGDVLTQKVVGYFAGLGFDSQRVDVSRNAKDTVLECVGKAGVLHFLLHGSVSGFGGVLDSSDIPEFGRPVIVFNNGCYGACIGRWYDQCAVSTGHYEDRARSTEPSRSIALKFLRNGAIAYYGHMCMWGDNLWSQQLMQILSSNTSASAGALVRDWYDKPKGPDTINDERAASDIIGLDWNRFCYASVVLYGDPAMQLLR